MKNYLLLGAILFATQAPAKNVAADNERTPAGFKCPNALGSDLDFPKGKAFEVVEYHPETETYRVLSVKFPDESEMFVTLEALVISSDKIAAKRDVIVRNPQEIVGHKFTGKKDLKVLNEKELEARRGCHR